MADKPDKFPDWATEEQADPVSGQLNRVEPPEFRKETGWTRREIPPRQWFNWQAWLTGRWIRWIVPILEGLGSMATRNAGTGSSQFRTNSQNDDRYNHRSNNLSDVADASTARDNLDVYSRSETDQRALRPLSGLTGSSTTITSGYDGVYSWDNTGGHTVTIGQQSSDEGATVTRLICRSGSDSNLTLNLASGVTANWSFDESESADGYEIKPGEIVELVKAGTNSYVAYAPNGISEVIELGGDFDSGVEVKASRIGPSVTIVNNSNLSHTGGSSPSSSAGVIPSLYRPQDYGGINMGSRNLYFAGPSTITMVEVSTGGQLTISYRDYSGGTTTTGSTSRMTISYLA